MLLYAQMARYFNEPGFCFSRPFRCDYVEYTSDSHSLTIYYKFYL